jgi:WS/DGAT/MGAT family acyltransferase
LPPQVIDLALRKLSGLDAGFLYLETPATPMHVGSLTVYDPPADLDGSFAARVRTHLGKRLHLAPLLHQQLAEVPLELGHPVWVEAGEVDLDWHVRSARVPRPGGMRQLEALVATLHAEPLDRARPLWQFTVIEGLKSGQVAMYAKVHHAALDGAAGVVLAQAMLDLSAVPREVPAGHAPRARRVSKRKLIGSVFENSLVQYAKIARAMPDAVKAVAGGALRIGQEYASPAKLGALIRELGAQGPAHWAELVRRLPERILAPRTRLNVQVGAERRYATLSLSLNEARAVGHALDATINDIVLAVVAGGLRRWLGDEGDLPRRSLVAAVPVSLREDGNAELSNQVTMLPASLATDVRDPAKRLAAIRAGMRDVKRSTGAFRDLIPTDFPSLGAPWLIGGLTRVYERMHVADRVPLPANLVVSNVPGPPVPLYLAGARMRHYYPCSIVVHGLALNVTVHSYDDALDFGLVACAEAVPDLAPLVGGVEAAFDELKAVAAAALSPAPAARRSRGKAAAPKAAVSRAGARKAAAKTPRARR